MSMCLFLCNVTYFSLCHVKLQPAVKAPPPLHRSGAEVRTLPMGTWCQCPRPRLLTCSVQQPCRTRLCSPAHDHQVLKITRVSSLSRFSLLGLMIFGSHTWWFSWGINVYLSLTVQPTEVDMSSPLMYGTPSSRVEGTPRSGVRGTPARQRPDLGSVRKAPQVDLHSEPVSGRWFKNIWRIV